MSKTKEKNYNFRALIPAILRHAGIIGSVIAVIVVGIGFYVASAKKEFRGKEFPAELSENVVGTVNGYQRKETENGVLKFFLKADTATTFDDNHQELKNISLNLYKDGDANVFDRIVSEKAIYIPDKGSKDFTVFFAGNVDITTHDSLEVKTDQLNYKSKQNVALAEERVDFKRKNVSGSSYGARVDIGNESIELNKDVEIRAFASNEGDETDLDLKTATLRAGYGFINGKAESIQLRNSVAISLIPAPGSGLNKPTEINSNSALVQFIEREIRRIELEGDVRVRQDPVRNENSSIKTKSRSAEALIEGGIARLSLFGDVFIESVREGGKPLQAMSDSAVYQRSNLTYELRDSVRISASNQSGPVHASAAHATYRQASGDVTLNGLAQVSQGGQLVKGNVIYAKLSAGNDLEFAKVENNAYLKQNSNGRFSEVFSDTISAWFANGKVLKKAEARGRTRVEVLPDDKKDYSKFRMVTPKGLDLSFADTGTISGMTTLGRSTLYLDAGTAGSSTSDKRLTADTVKTEFRPGGNELAKAHAIGNAELIIEPRSPAAGDYNSFVTSPRFDCDFYSGNNARNCVSVKRTKVKRESVSSQRPAQFLESDTMSSLFEPKSRDVKAFEASGNAKFTEGDRNGVAQKMVYTMVDETARFRGGNPTFWDSRARAKAAAIDWNTKDNVSHLSGGVSTTYYNQIQTGGAAPFRESRSPVFVTADTARLQHEKREAVYIGNARAWQDKNYVRGDKLFIEEKAGRFFGEGNVESVLYDAQRTAAGKKSKLPVFVKSGTVLYLRDQRQLRYEKEVDIRQGPDRIMGQSADIFLDSGNSLSKSIVRGDVVITQPGRKAEGDYAEHDAENETIVIRGSPASYSDSKTGSSSGKILTVDLKKNVAVNSGSDSNTGTGRIRSVYKVKPGRLN